MLPLLIIGYPGSFEYWCINADPDSIHIWVSLWSSISQSGHIRPAEVVSPANFTSAIFTLTLYPFLPDLHPYFRVGCSLTWFSHSTLTSSPIRMSTWALIFIPMIPIELCSQGISEDINWSSTRFPWSLKWSFTLLSHLLHYHLLPQCSNQPLWCTQNLCGLLCG